MMPKEAAPDETALTCRYHCGHCGQPVLPGAWLDLVYRYRDMEHRDRACPACLSTQTLLPKRPAA